MKSSWIAPLRIWFSVGGLGSLLLCSLPAQADVYRYLDANGMVHYTDNQNYAVKTLPTNGKEHSFNRDGVLVRVVEKPDGHYFFALNRLLSAVDLTFRFSQQHNLVIPQQMQQILTLPAKKESFIGKLSAQGRGDWRYHYDFSYGGEPSTPVQAATSSKFNARQIKLPADFANNKRVGSYFSAHHDLASPIVGRYRIAQGFNGDFSHNKLSNRYALDIALPVGTALYATRDGVVMAAVDSHVGGGLAPQYRGKSNHLRLRHADGSMTLYAHLQTGSLRVRKGDRVKVGQRVAASGNTGYSSGPHLHLALQIVKAGRNESIPFTLQGSQPVAGLWLSGTAWGDE
ncbi:MAG: M23 family metallopeptidase [Oceanisphaera sp.]|uniref:peptidoglycan DD-metalloendopeptidase family protein n=1 Tax=Oceanisphaera sp. TaxID=1929979 RepID=UPI003C74AD90